MRKDKYKTTTSDFNRFKKYCNGFIKRSKYTNWDVDFCHGETDTGNFAEVHFSEENKTATIFLNISLHPVGVTAASLEDCAFHEVCHIIMARLLRLAEKRYTTKEDLYDEEHAVIRALGRLMFNRRDI